MNQRERDCTKTLKQTVVDPIMKKDSLDHEVYKNYRPISNLSFISKATEKRLNCHLDNANLHEIFQSAYKKVLYNMYTVPLADIMRKNGMNFYFYADDTQI